MGQSVHPLEVRANLRSETVMNKFCFNGGTVHTIHFPECFTELGKFLDLTM